MEQSHYTNCLHKVLNLLVKEKISYSQFKVAHKFLTEIRAMDGLKPHILKSSDKLSILMLSPKKLFKFAVESDGNISCICVTADLQDQIQNQPYNFSQISYFLNIFKGNVYDVA